ncbi:MAG: hypothetical protein ACRDRW_15245 [Pseudonocardiaceae bacterium]
MLLHRVGDVGEGTDEHQCVVAGLRADGTLADVWGDARARPDGRYVAYVPRCECGWTGPPFSGTPAGYAACEQLWRDKHLRSFLRTRPPPRRVLAHLGAEDHARWQRTEPDVPAQWVP